MPLWCWGLLFGQVVLSCFVGGVDLYDLLVVFAGAGDIVVALGLATFAFSTMLGWSYYGERSFAYLFGERVIRPYRLGFVFVIGLAAVVELDVVWLISDILNGLMAAPNLVGLLLLSGVVWRETRSYFNR